MEQLLLTCTDLNFSVGDSLELSGIQFTPLKRTRHRQDRFRRVCRGGVKLLLIDRGDNPVYRALSSPPISS